jgi:hypothetical protein
MITNFLKLQDQLRIYHWQTKSYAEHEAFGKTYEGLNDLIDEFIEIFMGKNGRIVSKNDFEITLKNYGEGNVSNFIDDQIKFLSEELPTKISESDTDLLNIRDEMVGLLNKLKYLLTLK